MNSTQIRVLILFSTTFVSGTVSAAINTPPGLQQGDKFHLMFVTTGSTPAHTFNPSGSGYDFFVYNEAALAGLTTYYDQTVNWTALGSYAIFANPPSNAIDLFNPLSPVYRVDGVKIANDGADLWDGTLQNAINRDSLGVQTDVFVWTGTDPDGSASSSPMNNGLAPVRLGVSFVSFSNWVSATDFPWETPLHLYAFSSEMTVVPEPATIGLAVLGLASGMMRRRRLRD